MKPSTADEVLTLIEASSLKELKRGLLDAALRYAQIRTRWYMATPDGRRAMDSDRTRAHEALIDPCNILSRNQVKHGEDNDWRSRLGHDRKSIGDFACYVHCVLGLRAR